MHIEKSAVNHIVVLADSNQPVGSSSSSSSLSDLHSSSNSSTKQDEPGDTKRNTDIDDPVLTALKGYSLYNLSEKQDAIVNFLKLSSFSTVFTSGNPDINNRVEVLCQSTKNMLKTLKNGTSLPSKWKAKNCAEFIIDVVTLIEDDEKLSMGSRGRSSSRLKKTNILPAPAAKLVEMVEKTKMRLKSDQMENKKRKKSGTTPATSIDKYLLNKPIDIDKYTDIHISDIVSNLLSPVCNHRSLTVLHSKEEADKANKTKIDAYENKVKEWENNGKLGTKPRLGKTYSEELGCVCFMQNCIGNNDGAGCFKCKDLNGEVGLVHDTW